jgi:hypothetical protein
MADGNQITIPEISEETDPFLYVYKVPNSKPDVPSEML